jgi:hypothetical protein
MINNLKSCPFCGGEAYIETEGTVSRLFAKHTENCFFDDESPLRGLYSESGNAAAMLAEEWNMRAPIEIPDGYAIVPKEPSQAMADEAWKYGDQVNHIPADPVYSYKAMLSVALNPYAETTIVPALVVRKPLPNAGLLDGLEAMERAKALHTFTSLSYSLAKELEIVFRALTETSENGFAPEGYVLAPKEPSIEMVLAGEAAYEDQLFVRIVDKPSQQYPDEHTSELSARVAYRAMLGAIEGNNAPAQAVLVTPEQAADAGLECGDTACGGCTSGEGACMYSKVGSQSE